MYNHEPTNYKCPICPAVAGIENDDTFIKQTDIFYHDDLATGFISSFHLHPIIVPNQHIENVYDMPEDALKYLAKLSQQVALALKRSTSCEGVSILQNNEPSGGQDAFHYHLHILARSKNDDIYNQMGTRPRVVLEPKGRERLADAIKNSLESN